MTTKLKSKRGKKNKTKKTSHYAALSRETEAQIHTRRKNKGEATVISGKKKKRKRPLSPTFQTTVKTWLGWIMLKGDIIYPKSLQ